MNIKMQLSGSAYTRGHEQAAPAWLGAKVRDATLGRVETARAEGVFDEASLAYLAAQRAFHLANDPEGMAELLGIAEGFGFPEPELFAHMHLGTLRDLKGGAALKDGCSAWAVGQGPDGPMVVKNRDYSGVHLGVQSIAHHTGPDVISGGMLCLGSLGSPGAYSSGINAAGLALADTQVSVATHRVGWLRYFLMTRILARCTTVAEAVEMVRTTPHAGGGTLVLADATGATAAIELGAAGVTVTTGPEVWRTNHYTGALAPDTLQPRDDSIAANSHARFDYLARVLPGKPWGREDAQGVMGTHANTAPGAAPICQHGAADAAETISSAVYSCNLQRMDYCEGNPCTGAWRSISLAA
ncbi:C45 family autoproteolytic acyltransferase/hydolase [Phaeovulum sp.]|uniref:C45 family autoproteolytic acyltransferase/hydolase n=1 Tax=Phaeovulum sp. TaxID=2934796 RepID=UPI0035667EAA